MDTQAPVNSCPTRNPPTNPNGKAKAASGVAPRHKEFAVIQNGVLPPVTPKKVMYCTASRIHPPASISDERTTGIRHRPEEQKTICRNVQVKIVITSSHNRTRQGFRQRKHRVITRASGAKQGAIRKVNKENARTTAVAPRQPTMLHALPAITAGWNVSLGGKTTTLSTSRMMHAGSTRSKSGTSMYIAATTNSL